MSLPQFLLDVLGEIVGPTTCAACDEPVRPRVLFCEACVVTVGVPADGRAAFLYGGAVASAIARLKYRDRPDLGGRLGWIMAAVAPRDADLVVPVPLHPRRLAERGFNQSALLAAAYARHLRLPCAPRALERIRDTPYQMLLPRQYRGANVAGAFVCRIPQSPAIRGRRVLVVDDVTTTGATLEACAGVLRATGARSVTTLALALRDRTASMQEESPGGATP
jgi:ComF family protein